MKYFKTQGVYKASNVSFNPTTKQAFSYQWWMFTKVISGKLVFNNFRYSVTTGKHQRKVRELFQDLGIHIDIMVLVEGTLNNIDTLKELNLAEKETIEMLAAREEAKRIRRNEAAKARRTAKKLETSKQTGLKLIQGGAV